MAWWDTVSDFYTDAAGNVYDAAGNFVKVAGTVPPVAQIRDAVNGDNTPAPMQSPNGDYGGDAVTSNGAPLAAPTYAMQGGNPYPSSSSSGISTTSVPDSLTQRIMAVLGYNENEAARLARAAMDGNGNALKLLQQAGIIDGGEAAGGSGGSGGGGGGGGSSGRVLFPEEVAQIRAETDRIIAQTGAYNADANVTNMQGRQIGSLFDPNYADGAMVPMPDGTMRINGTEIIVDPRQKGQFKPVTNAPGYLVDPLTGTVIDTNGNQIRREELSETIRSNQAREGLTQAGINADVENNRNRLALDSTVQVGRHNLDAATTENEHALTNQLTTNRLNLDAFSSAGNLNNDAVNVETNRLNALTNRTAAGGNLALGQQELQDARTRNIIELASNPQNFVQREYETRALLAPPGYNGPAYKDNPNLNTAVNNLVNTTPDVSGLLPTYTAPKFNPAVLPNASLPRITAPTYTQLNTTAPTIAPQAPAANNQPATQAQASQHFRAAGVPDWALTPLGYAHGTEGTTEDEFIVGDPQQDGQVNPELVEIHNPGPNTTAEVTPLKDIMLGREIEQFAEGTGRSKNNKSARKTDPDMFEGFSEFMREMFDNLPRVYMSYKEQARGKERQKHMNRPVGWDNPPETLPRWNPDEWESPGIQDLPTSQYDSNSRINPLASNKNRVLQDLDTFAYGTNWQQGSQMPNGNFKSWTTNRYGAPPNGNQNSSGPSTQPVGSPSNIQQPGNGAYNGYTVDTGIFGPTGSDGNYLGQLTANSNQAIQNMPNIQYANNYGNQNAYNQLGTGRVNAAFGVNLPDVGGLNLRQLNDIALDPDAWGTLSSQYASGNRNLQSIYNRVLANAPLGNAVTSQTQIRTQ
jgi:hypothetical protein